MDLQGFSHRDLREHGVGMGGFGKTSHQAWLAPQEILLHACMAIKQGLCFIGKPKSWLIPWPLPRAQSTAWSSATGHIPLHLEAYAETLLDPRPMFSPGRLLPHTWVWAAFPRAKVTCETKVPLRRLPSSRNHRILDVVRGGSKVYAQYSIPQGTRTFHEWHLRALSLSMGVKTHFKVDLIILALCHRHWYIYFSITLIKVEKFWLRIELKHFANWNKGRVFLVNLI